MRSKSSFSESARLAALAACVAGALGTAEGRQAFTLVTASGSTPGQAFGTSLAGIGDVDGDGFGDLVVGAPFASPGGLAGAGQFRVISGASGLTLLVRNGGAAFGRFGAAIASVGDQTGDGVPEFVVGAPDASPGGISVAGQVFVYSGSDASLLRLSNGTATGGHLGASIAGVGDLDGDGLPDYAVCEPGISTEYSAVPGSAYAFSGADGSVLQTMGAVGLLRVAGVGDVEGDGSVDVLGGAPAAGPFQSGMAFVFSGETGAIVRFFAGAIQEQLGRSVAGCGDIDGDGVPDAALGAPGGNSVHVHSGADESLLLTLGSPGRTLASLGDIDGDDVSEVAVGSYVDVRVFSGATGALRWTIPTSPTGTFFGNALAAPGDMNGDGVRDLLAGDPEADPAFLTNAGVARAFSVVGVPAGASEFGAGCAGSGGFLPRIQTSGGPPAVGNAAFTAVLSEALGGTAAVLVAGFSSSTWLGVALPLNLGFLGLPACALSVSADQFLTVFTSGAGPGTGTAFASIPIAAAPALAGTTSYYQWYVVDPGPLALPGAMSAALQVTVQ